MADTTQIKRLIQKNTSTKSKNFPEYKKAYPNKIDLKPGSTQHDALLAEILERAQASYNKISTRYSEWTETKDTLSVFVRPDTVKQEARIVQGIDTGTKPKIHVKSEIFIPVSYLLMDTILTYMVSAFLNDPIFKYAPFDGKDMAKAALLERVIQYQNVIKKAGLFLHTFWRDSFAYGLAAVSPQWVVDEGTTVSITQSPDGTYERSFNQATTFEGNIIRNISPFRYLPDPNCSLYNIQEGNFIGWVETINLNELLSREQKDGDNYFNAKYARYVTSGISSFIYNKAERTDTAGVTDPVDLIHLYVNLVPKEWGIGKEEYPEKWLFSVACDSIIVSARPLDMIHNMFPVVVGSPMYDGYETTPSSHMESVQSISTAVNWLFNAHHANVRKGINGMIVVDPWKVYMKDLRTPNPEKIIRLRPGAYGKGVDNVIKQFDTHDFTSGFVTDAIGMMGIADNVAGAGKQLQGEMVRRGDRVSATEARNTRISAMSRLMKAARLLGMQGNQDLALMMGAHTQQLMSMDVFVSLAGEYAESLQETYGDNIVNGSMRVSPLDIAMQFNVVPNDGTTLSGEDAAQWIDLLQVIAQIDYSTQQEIPRYSKIVKHIARKLGVNNVEEFFTKVNVAPDQEEIQREVERGNLVSGGI